ncbi:MAG: hypothetical protein JSR91_23495 [Proteobacteria bacterium]|nr:hypothetical protein [Pseudomonadota bacterium]
MSDPFPAITEVEATGATAELFSDIRVTVGVKVVNLVWRHLATIDGALSWAWATVKPLYARGMVDQAAIRFRHGMSLPVLGSLAGQEPASVDAVLASYDHSNTVNLLALGALVAFLRGEPVREDAPAAGPRLPAPDIVLPKLASPEDTSAETWALVLRLNRFGDPQQVILASMYRHLAHAPGFLRKVEQVLAPVEADGTLERSIASNKAAARQQARTLACAIAADRPVRAAEIEAGIAAFVDTAIGKMVTICRAIRVARGNIGKY